MNDQKLTESLERLKHGDRRAIGRLISWVEDGYQRDHIMASIAKISGQAPIIGLTGPPGAGKSSLLEGLTGLYRQGDESVGIVAVDPSSPYTGGAILGDRIRMQAHGTDPGVFVRSMGTRGYPGGIACAAAEVLRILEAGGYTRLLLETVGVGQSELAIMGLADTVVVVLNPGAGDSIQAIKAGIMEIADIFVVNKADLPGAKQLKRDIEGMLDLNQVGVWRPPVVLTSTLTGQGLGELKQQIETHRNFQPQARGREDQGCRAEDCRDQHHGDQHHRDQHHRDPGGREQSREQGGREQGNGEQGSREQARTEQARKNQGSRDQARRDTRLAQAVQLCLDDKLRQSFQSIWPAWSDQAQLSSQSPQAWAEIIWAEIIRLEITRLERTKGGTNHD